MQQETAVAVIFSLIVLGGVIVIVAGMRNRARILEMAHRERLAMIERGLTPQGDLGGAYLERPAARSSRMLSLGIVIVGLGLGLALLIGFASREPEIAVGVGGAVAVIGGAFIVTALVVHGAAKPATDTYGYGRSSLDRSPPAPPIHRDPPASS
jgi:hypothetical protein